MNLKIVLSAAHFAISDFNGVRCGNIVLALGKKEKGVFCQEHGYLQLDRLQMDGEVDEAEVMYIRSQIQESGLPYAFPTEFDADREFSSDEESALKRFAEQFFHPMVDDLIKAEGITGSDTSVSPAIHKVPDRLQ